MSVVRSASADLNGNSRSTRYQEHRSKASQLSAYSRETRFPSTTATTTARTTTSNAAAGTANRVESATTTTTTTNTTTNTNSEPDSDLATPPPDSPSSEEWEENENGLMEKKGKGGIQLRRVKDPLGSSAPSPITPDEQTRNEVFDHLAYGGFLDLTLPSLYRWAAIVLWDIQLFRQTRCPVKHPEVANLVIYSTQKKAHRSRSKGHQVPPVLYRLFGENAMLPDSIRTSATARVLIVLHAIYYLSRLPVCSLCATEASRATHTDGKREATGEGDIVEASVGVGMGMGVSVEEVMPPYAVLDLRKETEVSFGGVSQAIVSRLVIDWAVAIRIAIAWLTDTPPGNYWEIHTKHIPDDLGAQTTRYFQKVVNYKFGLSNPRLMNMVDLVTEEHPIALTPPSRIRYSRKAGGVYYADMPSFILSASK